MGLREEMYGSYPSSIPVPLTHKDDRTPSSYVIIKTKTRSPDSRTSPTPPRAPTSRRQKGNGATTSHFPVTEAWDGSTTILTSATQSRRDEQALSGCGGAE